MWVVIKTSLLHSEYVIMDKVFIRKNRRKVNDPIAKARGW
jgi:hypothetical protein